MSLLSTYLLVLKLQDRHVMVEPCRCKKEVEWERFTENRTEKNMVDAYWRRENEGRNLEYGISYLITLFLEAAPSFELLSLTSAKRFSS